jgi:alkylation response protein AidB-like acyl-CoA dehydrogenase
VDFEFSDDQEMLRDSVRRFLAERAPIAGVRAACATDAGFDRASWDGLAAIGATALLVPAADGGAGAGMVDAAVVLEELGRAVHPGPFIASAVGAASLLALAGDGSVRARWLPPVADGTAVATVAHLEPGRRTEWRAPSTTATGGVLTGTKAHVAFGDSADLLLVVARDDAGLGCYAVDAGAAGLAVDPVETSDLTQRAATVRLDGVAGTRIGRGDATEAVAETVDRLGVAAAVDAVGAGSRALELAVEYAQQRVQFDRPIGSFQAVQHLCADMLHAVELARAGAYYACWAADDVDRAEAHRAAVMAQAWVSDDLARAGATAIQVFGGIGFTWEHDIHLFYKRILTAALSSGSADDHLAALADAVIR